MEIAHNAPVDIVLSDAMPLPSLDKKWESVIKGDQKSLSIAAASILAKVTRDRYMKKLDELYKQRTQLENAEMIDAIRSAKFDANEMLTVIHALKKGGTDLSALLLTIGETDTSVNSTDTKPETNNTESEDNDYETE